MRDELVEALAEGALAVHAPRPRRGRALWRWRDGVSLAVHAAARRQALRGHRGARSTGSPRRSTRPLAIGARHGLAACSWGHAGDGNVHATFLLDPGDAGERDARRRRGEELFDLALAPRRDASSGEHGIGVAQGAASSRDQWAPAAVAAAARDQGRARPEGAAEPRGQAARGAGGLGRPRRRMGPTASRCARRGSAPRTATRAASRSPSSRPSRSGRDGRAPGPGSRPGRRRCRRTAGC